MEATMEENGESKLDRLSDLNDDLIRKIFSSMSYIETLRFRFISKRLSTVWHSWLWDYRGRTANNMVAASLRGVVFRPQYRFLREIWLSSREFSSGGAVFFDCPLLRELTLVRCFIPYVLMLNSLDVNTISLVDCRGLGAILLDHGSDLHTLSYLPSLRDQDHPLRVLFNCNSPESVKVLRIVSSFRAPRVRPSFRFDDDKQKVLDFIQNSRICFDKTRNHVWINSFNDITSFYFIPGIKSFSFCGCVKDRVYPTVDIVYRFTTLKSLNLCRVVTTSRMIEGNLISNRFLKDVRLKDCQVRLSSEPVSVTTRRCYLKKAKLGSMKFLMEDGTEYDGYSKLQIRLRDFLYLFGHCTSLKLSLEKERKYMYPKKLRKILKPPLCEVKNLKLEKRSFLNTSIVNLVDNFLWLAPRLNTLSLRIGHDNIFTIKFHYVTQQEGVSDQTICHSNALYWKPQQVNGTRHEMTKIVIEIFQDYKLKEKLLNYFVRKVQPKILVVDQQS